MLLFLVLDLLMFLLWVCKKLLLFPVHSCKTGIGIGVIVSVSKSWIAGMAFSGGDDGDFSITSCEMVILVNVCIVFIWSMLMHTSIYPPYLLLLGPRRVPPLVRARIVLVSEFSS